MSRSVWKYFYVSKSILRELVIVKKSIKNKNKKNVLKRNKIKVWSRSSVILPIFVGHLALIHNGKTFASILITKSMVGYKFGEFAYTRKRVLHKVNKVKGKYKRKNRIK